MRPALFAILAFLCLSILMGGRTSAQQCHDPPRTAEGRCLKKAGAQCDPSSGWVGGRAAERQACRGSSGASRRKSPAANSKEGSTCADRCFSNCDQRVIKGLTGRISVCVNNCKRIQKCS